MDYKVNIASCDDVIKALNSDEYVVVDARSSSAFIGWQLDGEPYEGHIKGAVDFSADWLRIPEKSEKVLKQYSDKLKWRKITSSTNVIVYDYTGEDAPIVFEFFKSQGINNLSYFSLAKWEGEMEKVKDYSAMVPVQWVKELLDGNKPKNYLGKDFKIFTVAWKEPLKEFLEGHIPSSISIDSDEFELDANPVWTKPSDDVLEKFALKYGISVDTTVIIYGYNLLGIGAGAKLAVVLKYLGVKQVCLLNGVYNNWVYAGYPSESKMNEPIACEKFGGNIPHDPSWILDINDAKRFLANPEEGQLIDIRPWEQYIGNDPGYDYITVGGHIPGSVWCWNPYFYTNPDASMCNTQEMVDCWLENNVDINKTMAFFCGSASWGGAIIEFFGRIAGYEKASMYEGGWCEWQHDKGNPIGKGAPRCTIK
ncbi:MAG: sulfurtransferase [Lachnospirales bacterium]